MPSLHADLALTPDGWQPDTRVSWSADGRITAVDGGVAARADDLRLPGQVLLPAPANVHSHAFQRALAGMTEARGPGGRDSFWTWRTLMYRFLDTLTPEHIQAIAAQVYVEMLEAGYAAVGEFHYVHHAAGGGAYADIAETSARIAQAARETGIGLTHLPVYYRQAGLDGGALTGGQLRFRNDPDSFAALMAAMAGALGGMPADTVLGVAPHSLRAVPAEDLRRLAAAYGAAGPMHIHIAEQTAEIEAVEAAYGARPVAWLLDNAPVDSNWCAVHATHMTPEETVGLAHSGAVAGLCPITEANLGDGLFDGARFLAAGGALGLGSDSNVRISLCEELRLAEYSQRYRDRARAVLCDEGASTGRTVYDAVCAGGARALGRTAGALAPGLWADLLTLDRDALPLTGLTGDSLLDGWIFAGSDAQVREVWSAGRHVVSGGRHHKRDAVEHAFRDTLRVLRAGV